MSKKDNKAKGNYGEKMAFDFLEKEGYKILTRNFNCAYGEIDIVAKQNNEIIFIEVKTRMQNSYGKPIEAVDFNKKKHIYRAAQYYLYKANLSNTPVRFDVIEVYLENNKYCKINHIKNTITDMP